MENCLSRWCFMVLDGAVCLSKIRFVADSRDLFNVSSI